MLLPFLNPDLIEAGCDEAGRGCLCGPVCCAAVIFPKDFTSDEINDSKKLSHSERSRLEAVIKENALAWAVVAIEADEIDRINILNASIKGMHDALDQLHITPQHIIVDGNRFKPYRDIPATTVVKGDAKYLSIAAASILAKTFRDRIMEEWSQKFPQYGWDSNKGYPTKSHREAIKKFGPSPIHRLTFRLLPE